MKFLFTVFGEIGFFEFPKDVYAWLVWLGFLAFIVWLLWTVKKFNTALKKISIEVLILLLLAIPITSFLFAIRLGSGSGLALPGIPLLPVGSLILLFSAIPWMLAAAYLGPQAGSIIGVLSGLIFGFYGNHSFFTPLIFAFIALFFSLLLRQRYRTTIFRYLRKPIVSSLVICVIYPIFFLITTVFVINASFPVRIDYVLSHLSGESLAFAIQVLLAGAVVEIITIAYTNSWFDGEELEPSPSEKSLEARLYSLMAPLVLLFFLVLFAGDWIVAGNVARNSLETQMRLITNTAAESIPIIQTTGQSLLMQARDDQRLKSDFHDDQLISVLQELIRQTPFFDQLSIVDINQVSIAGYPENNFENIAPSPYEKMAVELASTGLDFQYYTLPPTGLNMSARLSFIVPILNELGQIERVLIGRTSLDSNPFFIAVLQNLNQIKEIGGQAALVDSQKQYLFHTESNKIGIPFDGEMIGEENFFFGTNSKGLRVLEFYKPVKGQSWAVVTTVPAQVAQQATMDIAFPLLGLLIILILFAYFMLRYSLRSVTKSIENLVAGSVRISEGDLDQALDLKGSVEVGQLGRTFEKMRRSLKSRLDDSNRLLLVSQGLATSLNIESAIQPLLEGALATGGSSARLALTAEALSEFQKPAQNYYGLGESTSNYEGIDDQILNLSKTQAEIVLKDLSRSNIIHPQGLSLPASLIAIALKKDRLYYGTLWVGYENLHHFSKEEIRYLTNVAEQASLSITNARVYSTAILERQRLEAIFFSTKDPIIVTNQKDQILLVNPAAKTLLGYGPALTPGMSLKKLKAPKALIDLLILNKEATSSVDIVFSKERTFNASASAILADGQVVGRVCVLRDLTHISEIEKNKAELISLVSHELRSPLTLVQGSATMLKMVGDLNEEQEDFLLKIVTSVENMTEMVNNLLAIERVEEGKGLRLENVSVKEVAEEATEAMKLLAIQKQIKLTLELPDQEMPMIKADKTLLVQALQNLIENGINFTESGGAVDVSLAQKSDSVIFVVKDNGVGIAPIDQQKVFERFYRAESFNNKKDKSSGLGLSIVKSIAEKHGGEVDVESQLGLGSRFYLSIPRGN